MYLPIVYLVPSLTTSQDRTRKSSISFYIFYKFDISDVMNIYIPLIISTMLNKDTSFMATVKPHLSEMVTFFD